MTPNSEIQTEIVDATGFEPTKNYERQDYLAALARAANDLDTDDFDALSVDAQDWFNSAVKALNKKEELPEFPDVDENAEPEGEEEQTAEDADEEVEAEPQPPPKKVKAKKAKAQPEPEAEEEVEAEPEPPKKRAKPLLPANADRYGVTAGSKNHRAIQMFEDGCRMGDVTEKVGGTYYNLLGKLKKAGHKVEKSPNGITRLTHSDDVAAPKKVKAKK